MTIAGARHALWICCSGALMCFARPAAAQAGTDSAATGYLAPVDTSSVVIDTLRFTPDTQLTLGAAVAQALRVGPEMARAAAALDVARGEQRVAIGEYLPSFGLTTAVERNGLPSQSTVTASGTLPVSNPVLSPRISAQTEPTPIGVAGNRRYLPYASLAAGWDLFTAGRRPADMRRARADVRAAESGDVERRFRVISDVKTAFFDVLRAEDLQQVAAVQVKRAEQDVRAAARRRDVGTATPSDVLQFELNLASARQALVQAMIDRRSAAYALGRLAGLPRAAEAAREGAVEPSPLLLPDSAIVVLAERQAPALLAARDSADAAQAAVTTARTQYVPTIRGGVSYTWAGDSIGLGGVRAGWALSIGTSYPLFNGFQREYQVERAVASAQVATAVARDAERAVRADVERLLGGVALAADQVTLARGAVTVAREYYRVQSSRFAVGVATVLDLSTAEQNVAQAEQRLVNARYDYQLARANLETLVGRSL